MSPKKKVVKKVVKKIVKKVVKKVVKKAPLVKKFVKVKKEDLAIEAEVKVEVTGISKFDASKCICTTFWDPHEYGEIVEYQGEHWHFRSDLPWSNGERGPGIIRQEVGTEEADQRRQGVSFTREEIKHGN